jgi:molecular chaperone GrpE
MTDETTTTTDEVVGDVNSTENISESTPGQATDPVAELTAALQRERADFTNFRKRTESERITLREMGVAQVLTELLATLDDIERADSHGELTGGFKAVADQLTTLTTRLGLEKYGKEGDEFDPQIHEALMHSTSSDVTVATATAILQPGYKYKERVLRPARVSVVEPE